MEENLILLEKHQQFVESICQTKIVWALEGKDGYATTFSEEFENEEGIPAELLCFWSSQENAMACIKKEWKNYKAIPISLTEFIENWCIGMSNDELFVGTDFDIDLLGYEADPLELIIEIADELIETNNEIELNYFKSLNELKIQVQETLI